MNELEMKFYSVVTFHTF